MNLKVADAKREEGFTLIELLVVVIIIGILAAIAIPIFLNQRERAWRGSTESDARNLAIEVETLATRDGDYPTVAGLNDPVTAVASAGVTLFYDQTGPTDAEATEFQICAEHGNLGGESVTYDSSLGGLRDWNDEEGCATSDDYDGQTADAVVTVGD